MLWNIQYKVQILIPFLNIITTLWVTFTGLAIELNHSMETQISILYYFVLSYLVVLSVNSYEQVMINFSTVYSLQLKVIV